MQQIEEQLKKLIAEYGKQLVVEEPRRTAALLRDLFAQHKREARVLIAVVEEGLTAELVRDAGKTSAGILLPRQAKSLHDELGIDEKLALWAVHAWAEALGWSLPALKVVATAAKPAVSSKPSISTPIKAPAQQKTLPLIGDRYLDNDDGTVTDSQTGLQWMRCSLGQEWDGKTCIGTAKGFKWQKALDAADELNQKGGYAGHQDWRVPTTDELKSLILKTNKPTIDLDTFPNTPIDWFWSSSPNANLTYNAWFVYFGYGDVHSHNKNDYNRVRLVRADEVVVSQSRLDSKEIITSSGDKGSRGFFDRLISPRSVWTNFALISCYLLIVFWVSSWVFGFFIFIASLAAYFYIRDLLLKKEVTSNADNNVSVKSGCKIKRHRPMATKK